MQHYGRYSTIVMYLEHRASTAAFVEFTEYDNVPEIYRKPWVSKSNVRDCVVGGQSHQMYVACCSDSHGPNYRRNKRFEYDTTMKIIPSFSLAFLRRLS